MTYITIEKATIISGRSYRTIRGWCENYLVLAEKRKRDRRSTGKKISW